MLEKFILFMFSAPSLTYALLTTKMLKSTREGITKRGQSNKLWRHLDNMTSCELCLGTWVGLLMYFLIIVLDQRWLGYMLASGGGSALLYKTIKSFR